MRFAGPGSLIAATVALGVVIRPILDLLTVPISVLMLVRFLLVGSAPVDSSA